MQCSYAMYAYVGVYVWVHNYKWVTAYVITVLAYVCTYYVSLSY